MNNNRSIDKIGFLKVVCVHILVLLDVLFILIIKILLKK